MALKVLLADDSVPAQNMGKKILTDAGYEVMAVSNGLEALKKIADSVPDIAILDIFMPGYTGLEVCSRLRGNAVTAQLPVILTVGKLEPYRPEEGEKVHSNAVIVKPFSSEELLSAVRSLVGLPFAIRPEAPEGNAAAAPEPAHAPEPEDDYEEEAPMLAGIGFDGFSGAPAASAQQAPAGKLEWDPSAKRMPFIASAVEEAPSIFAQAAVNPPAFEAASAAEVAVGSPANKYSGGWGGAPVLNEFEVEPAATSTTTTATALVEWCQPTADDRPAAAGKDAAQETPAKAGEQIAIAAPAFSPDASLSAVAASAQPATESVEAPALDRESRMQAFEALFNSDEAIPVQENPASLPDLLAEEELEALQEDEAETVPPIAMEDGLEQRPHIAAAASSAKDPLGDPADLAGELQLDSESIENWLTTEKVFREPEPPAVATPLQANVGIAVDPTPAPEDRPVEAASAGDSFYAGIDELMELPKSATIEVTPDAAPEATPALEATASAEATAPMVCYLPKEPASATATESSVYGSLEPAATKFAYEDMVAKREEAPQIEAPEIEASLAEAEELHSSLQSEPVHPSAELAAAALEQEFSEIVELAAEAGQAIDENAEAQDSVPAAANEVPGEPQGANPGGEAKRIHQAVESVFERFRPLLIAAIARELTRRE